MSYMRDQQFNTSSGHDPSLDDLRLFQRLMRIAHLLQTHNLEDIYHQDFATDQHGCHSRGNAIGTKQVVSIEDDNVDGNGDEARNEQMEVSGEKETITTSTAMLSEALGTETTSALPRQLRQSRTQQSSMSGASAQHRYHQRQRPHAAVERRYRAVLNSKIQQLHTLIPASGTFTTASSSMVPDIEETILMRKAPSKSVVLDKAIQYIKLLVYTYEQYEKEQDELTRKLQQWLDTVPSTAGKSALTDG